MTHCEKHNKQLSAFDCFSHIEHYKVWRLYKNDKSNQLKYCAIGFYTKQPLSASFLPTSTIPAENHVLVISLLNVSICVQKFSSDSSCSEYLIELVVNASAPRFYPYHAPLSLRLNVILAWWSLLVFTLVQGRIQSAVNGSQSTIQ